MPAPKIKKKRRRIPQSNSIPNITWKESRHGVMRIRIDNPDHPNGPSSERPYKVQMERFIGEEYLSPDKIFWGGAMIGKGRYFTWLFSDEDKLKGPCVYYSACYVNAKREKGVFSTIICEKII